jgi:hypothetical protein
MPYNRPGAGVYVTNGGTSVLHGAPVKIANFVGVAVKQRPSIPPAVSPTDLKTIAASEQFFLITKGIVQVDNVTGFAKGDAVYIDGSNVLTESSSGNTKFGRVVEVPGERGTPTGKVRIDLDAKDSIA